MIVRALDRCGDISTRGTQYVRDVRAVEELVKMRLRLFLGEYFRNITDGTPWWQDVLGKQPDRSLGEQALRSRISMTDGVLNIIRFEVTYEDRTMFVQCDFNTIYGEGNIEHGTTDF